MTPCATVALQHLDLSCCPPLMILTMKNANRVIPAFFLADSRILGWGKTWVSLSRVSSQLWET